MPSTKRRRLNKPNPLQEDVYQSRVRNDLWLKSRFESIFAKYERNFEEIGDEIELDSGRIVVDNGHLLSMHDEYDVGRTRQMRMHDANAVDKPPIPAYFSRLLEEKSDSRNQYAKEKRERHLGILSPPDSFQRLEDDDVDSLLGDVQSLEEHALGCSKQVETSTWMSGSLNQGGPFQFDTEPAWQAPPLPLKQPLPHRTTPPLEPLGSHPRTSSSGDSHLRMSLWADTSNSTPHKSSTCPSASSRKRSRGPGSSWTKDEVTDLQRLMTSGYVSLNAIASKFPEKPKKAVAYRLSVMRRLMPSEMEAYISSFPAQVMLTPSRMSVQEGGRPSFRGRTESRRETLVRKSDLISSTNADGQCNPPRTGEARRTRSGRFLAEKVIHNANPQTSLSTSPIASVIPAKGPHAFTNRENQMQKDTRTLSAEKTPSLKKDQNSGLVFLPPYTNSYPPIQSISSKKAAEPLSLSARPTSLAITADCPFAIESANVTAPKENKRKSSSSLVDMQSLGRVSSSQSTPPVSVSCGSIATVIIPPTSGLSGIPLPVRTKTSSAKVTEPSTLKKPPDHSLIHEKISKASPFISTPRGARPAAGSLSKITQSPAVKEPQGDLLRAKTKPKSSHLAMTPQRAQVAVKTPSRPRRMSSLLEDLSEDELSTPIPIATRIRRKSVSCKKAAIPHRSMSEDEIDDLQL